MISCKTEDDAASTSSTVSVERAAKLPRRGTVPTRQIRGKRVRFDEGSSEINSIPITPVQDAWYTVPELKALKLACFSEVKEMAQSEKENTHEQCYIPCMIEMFKACCAVTSEGERESVSPEHEVIFNDWVQGLIDRIGTERGLVRHIAKDKALRRAKIVRKVENYQTICFAQGRRPDPQHIVTMCQSISRPSRLFARRLAAAQSSSY